MSVTLPTNRDVDAWQVAIWNAHDAFLSRPQRLTLMLMLEASFNAFDAFTVVRDLIDNRRLWTSVEMTRGFPMTLHKDATFGWYLHDNLISLRDMGRHWNVDTVYILHEPAHADRLRQLTASWSADEIGPVPDDAIGPLLGIGGGCGRVAILRMWWD